MKELLIILLVASGIVALSEGAPRKAKVTRKPGTCPETRIEGFCFSASVCTADSNCPDDEKCCTTGCGGRNCYSPLVTEKPGTCPETRMEGFCFSASVCTVDTDCPDNKKCCRTGCDGRKCYSPRLQR